MSSSDATTHQAPPHDAKGHVGAHLPCLHVQLDDRLISGHISIHLGVMRLATC